MKKSILIWLIAFLLVLPFSFAQLDFNPILGIDINTSDIYEFRMPIRNLNNFTIHNITIMENLSNIMAIPIDSLEYNQTKDLVLKVNVSSATDLILNANINYYYNLPISSTPIVHNVTINPTSFSPTSITIRQNDVISWRNNATVPHTITNTGTGSFDSGDIAINSTFQRAFADIMNINYFSKTNFMAGSINIINRTDIYPIISDANKQPLTINLRARFKETSLLVQALDTNLTVPYRESRTSGMRLTNIGNQTAKIVSLSGKWLSFTSSGFDMAIGESRVVSFTIQPIISFTNETDKNYTITITAEGLNTGKNTQDISVYIPYFEIAPTNASNLEYLKYLHEVFCPSHPTSILCIQEPIKETQYIQFCPEPVYIFNMSPDERNAILTGIREDKLGDERAYNFLTLQLVPTLSTITSDLNTLKGNTESVLQTCSTSSERINESLIVINLIIAGTLLVGGAVAGFVWWRNHRINSKLKKVY